MSGGGSGGAGKVAYALRRWMPHSIVLVDPQPHLVREVEVFCAERSVFKSLVEQARRRISSSPFLLDRVEQEMENDQQDAQGRVLSGLKVSMAHGSGEEEGGEGRRNLDKDRHERKTVSNGRGEEGGERGASGKEEQEEGKATFSRATDDGRMPVDSGRDFQGRRPGDKKEERQDEGKSEQTLGSLDRKEDQSQGGVLALYSPSPSSCSSASSSSASKPSSFLSSSPPCVSSESSSSSSTCSLSKLETVMPSYVFGGTDMHVFVLVLQHSVELEQYLSNIQVEQTAWKMLFQQKQHLLVPLDDLLLFAPPSSSFSSLSLSTSSSRSAVSSQDRPAAHSSAGPYKERQEGASESEAGGEEGTRSGSPEEGSEDHDEELSSWGPLLEAKRERARLLWLQENTRKRQPDGKQEEQEGEEDNDDETERREGGKKDGFSSSNPHSQMLRAHLDRDEEGPSSSYLTAAEVTAASLHFRQYLEAMGVDAHAAESSRRGGGAGAFLRKQVQEARRKAMVGSVSSSSSGRVDFYSSSSRSRTSGVSYRSGGGGGGGGSAGGRTLTEGGPERWLLQQAADLLQPQVVVDMREMRSSLPFELFCKRLRVVPMTFGVGDYVLSR